MGHGAEGQRPDHQGVAERADRTAEQRRLPVGARIGPERARARDQRVSDQRNAADQEQPGDEPERAAGDAYAERVGHGIGADENRRDQAEDNGLGLPRRGQAALEREARDRQRGQQQTGQRSGRKHLAGEDRAPAGDQERRRPARHRIDVTQVADLVGLQQEEKVPDVKQEREQEVEPTLHRRDLDEGQHRKGQDRPRPDHQRHGQRPVLAGLDHGVPGRVQHGGQQDQGDNVERQGHRQVRFPKGTTPESARSV